VDAPRTVKVETSPNGWYIAGNIVFGGIIGWFIVDPFSGAMYNLSPESINADLGEKTSSINGVTSFKIVLLEDVPMEFRDKMVKLVEAVQ